MSTTTPTSANGQRPINRHDERVSSEILDRVPPSNEAAEAQVVGSLLLDPGKVPEVRSTLRPADFHHGQHRTAYGVILTATDAGEPIDPTLLAARLDLTGQFPDGSAAYLTELIHSTPVASHANYYAALVLDSSRRRLAIQRGIEIVQGAYDPARNLGELLAGAATGLQELAEDRKGAIDYRRITCAELDADTYDMEDLIDGLLVARQPCILAGGKKTLKTSLLVDLGISLANGGCFLGHFRAKRACRVGIMSGESGLATIQETARRVCAAAGYRLASIEGLVWSDQLPQFGSAAHELALRKWIMADELEVVAVDPTYLCISDADHGNLFEMGAKLRGVSEVCHGAGAMLVLCHHNRKTGKADPYSVPELEDIAWAGFQEFARQWLLIGRREPYVPGTGEHRLWLSAGGSAGNSEAWAVDVAEGRRSDPGGRRWDVKVLRPDDARREVEGRQRDAKDAQVQERAQQQLDADRRRVVDVLVKHPNGETKSAVRDRAGINSKRVDAAIASLLEDNAISPVDLVKPSRKKPFDGYKLSGATIPHE